MDSKDSGKNLKDRGPDRRVKPDPAFKGPERRKAERRTNGDATKR